MNPTQLRAMREGKPIPPDNQVAAQMGPPMLTDGSQPMMDPNMMMDMGYNPMLQMGGPPDIRRVDRWLQYKPLKKEDEGKFWVTETELAEEQAKGNLTREEYNWFIREYAEIEAIAGGDGNEKWVRSRQRKFMQKLILTRSRSDNKEIGLRDGTLLMTQNVNQRSDVKMPTENLNPSGGNGGFFGFLRGR